MIQLADIVHAVPCKVTHARAGFSSFTGVSTDSKTVKQGELFFALRGHRHDGHDFVEQALAGGALGAVVSRDLTLAQDATIVRVGDTLEALQRLGTHLRRKYNPTVIGVTGSAGKTTTKDMTAHVLASHFTVLKSPASFNNHIGVPWAMAGLEAKHSHVVIEIGTNHSGEIAALAGLSEPDVGIITNIGHAHIEHFGSQSAIFEEKSTLLENLREGGAAILNGDDPFLSQLVSVARAHGRKVTTVGLGRHNDIRAEDVSYSTDCTTGTIRLGNKSEKFLLRVAGEHLVYAALLAVAVGISSGVDVRSCLASLRSFALPTGRLNVSRMNGRLRVIDDSYNASPEAMLAALTVLGRQPEKTRIAVLGEMRELGNFTKECHWQVGKRAASAATHLVAVGSGGELIREAVLQQRFDVARVWWASSALDALERTRAIIESSEEDCVVLVKGARFTHMERVGLGVAGVLVTCGLQICPLYINCERCPRLEQG